MKSYQVISNKNRSCKYSVYDAYVTDSLLNVICDKLGIIQLLFFLSKCWHLAMVLFYLIRIGNLSAMVQIANTLIIRISFSRFSTSVSSVFESSHLSLSERLRYVTLPQIRYILLPRFGFSYSICDVQYTYFTIRLS